MTIELLVIITIMFKLKSRAFIWVSLGLFIFQIIAYPLVLNLNQEIQMSIYLSVLTVFLSCYIYRSIFRKVNAVRN
jgi:hypothetical protein